MVKTHPPTHFFSSPSFHFENTHHLFLGFLHPLRFLNFDRLNHFKHVCSTKFVSSDQLTHESKKFLGKNLSSSLIVEGTNHLKKNLDNILWQNYGCCDRGFICLISWLKIRILSHRIPCKFCNNKIEITTSSMAIIISRS